MSWASGGSIKEVSCFSQNETCTMFSVFKIKGFCQAWWFMTSILASRFEAHQRKRIVRSYLNRKAGLGGTQCIQASREVEIGRRSGKKLAGPFLVQAVEYVTRWLEVLSLSPITAKNKSRNTRTNLRFVC
jgi:hypothetical protein